MVRVGITGGIGSGKSTICDVWQSHGAYIINADELAKNLMIEKEAIVADIVETFGEKSYHKDGSLNRKFLAQKAFGEGRVDELNAIVHPHIPAAVEALMEEAGQKGCPVAVYEAALLFENLRPAWLDHVVLVLADRRKRLEWVKRRDGVGEQPVMDRMEKQQNFEEFRGRADIVIENNGTIQELKEKAKAVYDGFVAEETGHRSEEKNETPNA